MKKEVQEKLINKTIEALKERDDELFANRNKKQFRSEGFRTKTIIFDNKKFKIKRRLYFDTINKKYVYLLDDDLGYTNKSILSKDDQDKLFELVAKQKMSYEQVKTSFDNCFSKSFITKVLKQGGMLYQTQFQTNPKDYKNLYIDIDDTFNGLKFQNKKQKYKFKMVHIYQHYDDKTKEFMNELKALLINPIKLNSFSCMKKTIKYIKKLIKTHYGKWRNFDITVSGDGARYIKTIAKLLHAKVKLDKWHCNHKVRTVFNIANLKRDLANQDKALNLKDVKKHYCKEIINNLQNGLVDDAIESLEEAKTTFANYKQKVKDIQALIVYLKQNQDAILLWQEANQFGTFTETFVQALVKAFFGNKGKCYSLTVFLNLLKMNSFVYYFD